MKDTNATVLIDLSNLNFDKDVWWSIKKAVKSGLQVEESKDFNSIFDILDEVLTDGGLKPVNRENLIKNTRVLFICKRKGKPIGMASLMMRNDLPTLNYLASKRKFNPLCPNYLLIWNCILWANANGYHTFDMGGWQINASDHLQAINKFKEQFGEVYYYEEEYEFLRAIGRKLIKNSKLVSWINRKIRGRNE